MTDVLLRTDFSTGTLRRGKVRDIYDLGERLLIIATDRISAFDVVLPTGIPEKGRVLTQLSLFWFDFLKGSVATHFLSTNLDSLPQGFQAERGLLEGRSMLVRKAEVIPVECVVRGYLAGSGWRDYQASGAISGSRLPQGLVEADKLPEPVFTPQTKATSGHDETITLGQVQSMVGRDLARTLAEKSIALYEQAAEYARSRGIIVSDTKFEWGLSDGKLLLIDEVLTPDSSRFWPEDSYQPGRSQVSFDKQYVRDWLESSGWNKEPPAPELPPDVVDKTTEKYLEAYRRLTGNELDRP